MSTDTNTPRTDANAGFVLDSTAEYPQEFDRNKDGAYVTADFARQLETELQAAQAEVSRLQSGIVTRENVWETQNRELTALRAEVARLNKIITGPFADTAMLHETLDKAGCVSTTKAEVAELREDKKHLTAELFRLVKDANSYGLRDERGGLAPALSGDLPFCIAVLIERGDKDFLAKSFNWEHDLRAIVSAIDAARKEGA